MMTAAGVLCDAAAWGMLCIAVLMALGAMDD